MIGRTSKYILRLSKIIFCFVFISCNSTKYVPSDRLFLSKTKVEVIGNKDIKPSEIEPLVKLKPNKRLLNLFRFNLWLYNLSSADTSQKFNQWLRRVGESPSIYDPFLANQAKKQIELYLFQKGYFNSIVRDSLKIKNRKAKLYFKVYPALSYHVRQINYNIEDSALIGLVMSDTINCLIKPYERFDFEKLQAERTRIETLLRNNGYFSFNKEFIYYIADTNSLTHTVDLTLGIKKFQSRDTERQVKEENHKQYRIQNIQVWIDHQRTSDTLSYIVDSVMYDIVTFDNIPYFFRDKISINPKLLHRKISIRPGMLYSQKNVEETYQQLTDLRIFKFINIGFVESHMDSTWKENLKPIDCKIQLSTQAFQSYQTDFELTNRVGFGFAGSINYQHRNFIKSAEVFNFRIKGNTETVKSTQEFKFKNTLEFGVESSITIPKLLFPFASNIFLQQYNPRTNFLVSYNFLRRIQYTHQIFNTSYGFNWSGKTFNTFQANLIDINYIRILKIDSTFYRSITNAYLRNIFQDHFLIISGLYYTFNNQKANAHRSFQYLKIGIEGAGNTTYLFMKLLRTKPAADGSYNLLGIRYAQYTKIDFDFRNYIPVGSGSTLVLRFFTGTAYPYGNSSTIPFEKQYFAGGANSMRAWSLRSLGPGAFHDTISNAFPDKTGDIKIETNIELRFKLFWKLEGAVFTDIGNIWLISKNDDRVDAQFKINKFIEQLAIGSGIGTRLNFSYFIVRFDLGLKIYDPSEISNKRWVITQSDKKIINLLNPTIGIGYPF